MLRGLFYFTLMLILSYVESETIHLTKISSLYVPSSYSGTGTPLFSLGSGSAEQLAYDPGSKFVYVVGKWKLYFFFLSLFSESFLF